MRALLVVALSSLVLVAACPDRAPTAAPVAPPVDAAPAPPPLDAARVLAILGEHAPSVAVSVQSRGTDVGLELRGDGEPATALALLSSLAERLPGTRVARLQLDGRSWTASLATSNAPVNDGTALAAVVAVARPVFAGDRSLLASGVVEPTAAGVVFRGAVVPGRSMIDAAAVVPSGFTLAKVEAGPPFVLELARAP